MASRANNKPIKSRLSQKSWRFWLAGSYLAIVLVFVVCWVFFVFYPVNTQLVQDQTTTLTVTAKASAQAVQNTTDVQEIINQTTKDSDLRITVIKTNGDVIADTSANPTAMENHLQREEVQQALAGSVGVTQRESVTEGQNYLYVAVPATYGGNPAVVRVSEPLSSLDLMTSSVKYTAFVLIGLGVVIAVIIALFSLKRSAEPVNSLKQIRTDFVANASHELKTPVAGIRLLSEAIQDAVHANDKKALMLFTERLDAESQRLQRLVVDLLDLSRLESNTQPRVSPRADLRSTLLTSLMVHKNQAEDKGLTLELIDTLPPEEHCYADMEPSDASLIFDNLIENAIMYTDSGKVTLEIKIQEHFVVISVSDTGIGIPPVEQSRIFERFYRVDKARSREAGGTGLGLSLVRHATERAHGTIRVKSKPGKGSVFSVSIPKSKHKA